MPSLLSEHSGPIDSFTGDRGDDQASIYDDVLGRNRGASIVIHPRGNGVHSDRKHALKQRNVHLKSIRSEGIYRWRRESGYYRQRTVEHAFYRYKTITEKKLRAQCCGSEG